MNKRIITLSIIIILFFIALGISVIWPLRTERTAYKLAEKGSRLAQAGKFDEGISFLTEAAQLNPDDPYIFNSFTKGYVQKGEYDVAIAKLTGFIHLHPKASFAYLDRGVAYMDKHEYGKARNDFNQSLALNKTDLTAWYDLGLVDLQAKDFGDALTDFGKSIKLSSTNAKALEARAETYSEMGKFTNAIKDFSESLRYGPGRVSSYNGFAWLLATCPDDSIRNGKKAFELARKACDLSDWKKWYCVGTLAASYAECGNFDEAIKFQKQALELQRDIKRDKTDDEKRLVLYEKHQPYREPAPFALHMP